MTPEIDFASAAIALRPPRIAIMVADDEHWRDWAMTALSVASGYWGGAGFILVPFSVESARPAPEFAEVVRAYDPDHVVSLDLPWHLVEEWYPGNIRIEGVDDTERRRLIAHSHHHLSLLESEKAREEVVSWCSPLRAVRFQDDSSSRQMENVTKLRARNDDDIRFRRGFAPAPAPSDPLAGRLAASTTWRSDLGLMAAMRVGVAQKEAGTGPRPEPQVDGLDWLIRQADDAPEWLIWNGSNIPTQASAGLERWFLADQHLLQVSNAYMKDRGAIVVGDSGSDFALAVAYDRLIGGGIWLPRAIVDDDEVFRRQVQPQIWMTTSDLEANGAHLAITSISQPESYIAKVASRLSASPFPTGVQIGRAHRESTVRVGPAAVDGGYLEYVVDEHIGVSTSIPVRTMADGTTEALTGLEAPVPSELVYPASSGWVPYWYVEVTRIGDLTPRARDLPAHALIVAEGSFPTVNLRANRESVTIDPHSMGLVLAGAFLPSRIGRPRLRGLSMTAWVEAMAEPEGLGVRLSQAGRQAELVRRRLGSRNSLLDLMTPQNVRMLRAFIRRERKPTSEERQLNPEIVVLEDLDPFLTFDAMGALLAEGLPGTRKLVDQLISARLLRRGLILDCVECGRPSFIDADRVQQTYECPQCAAANVLVSARWKENRPEPRWFYDLYTAFRELLAANGDAVLLAAASLRASARSYLDAPELEFYDLESGFAVAEVDVIASVNREVVLVEAKSNGTFGGKMARETQTQKLLLVAQALRSERVILATTKDGWNATDLRYLEKEGARIKPFSVSVEEAKALGRIPAPPRARAE